MPSDRRVKKATFSSNRKQTNTPEQVKQIVAERTNCSDQEAADFFARGDNHFSLKLRLILFLKGGPSLTNQCRIGSLRREVVHSDGILEQRVVAGDDDDAGFGDEVALAVGFGVVADSGALGEMNVAVDNGAADAAVASDADVSEEDAGVNF